MKRFQLHWLDVAIGAFAVLRANYGLESNDFRYNEGELVLGKAHIPVAPRGRLLVDYVKKENNTGYKFSDVRNKKVRNDVFAGKIVLIGMMATGGGDQHTTPIGTNIPGVMIHANVIQGILNIRHDLPARSRRWSTSHWKRTRTSAMPGATRWPATCAISRSRPKASQCLGRYWYWMECSGVGRTEAGN
ncbi:MAG: CHASE2 domain-containing protein [Acidobacteriales bacterium]|nr:CHASE2 domain-containing protein [Terriglobales bacterium]